MTKPDPLASIQISADRGVGTNYLPLDIATESIAIVARKGAGKSHTARVLVEGLIQHHIQTVIVDPVDVWWGLRANAAGTGPGLDVVVFGGSHADLPLLEGSGTALADLIVDKGISALLVLDHLTQGAQRRFMADFGTRLYERKSPQEHRTPLHVVIDEADAFIPQKVYPEGAKCHGAVDRIVRRGRSRGLGTTIITQRPAVVSKDVLTQTEILICLQVTGPQDRKALQEWIDANATKEQKATFLAELPTMQRGEAFVWSPAKLKCFFKCLVRQTTTFDSSYTPAVGKARVSPTLKQLDLTAIRASLEEVVKEATENDPKVLKGKLRTAEAAIAVLQKERGDSIAARDTVQGRLDEASRRVAVLEQQLASAINVGAGDSAKELVEIQTETTNALLDKLRQFIDQHPITPLKIPRQVDTANFVMGPGNRSQQVPPEVTRRIVDDLTRGIDARRPTVRGSTHADTDLVARPASGMKHPRNGDLVVTPPKCEYRILTVLAQGRTSRLSRERVAAIAGYSPGGGGFNNSISALKSKGYIGVEGNDVYLTQAGANAVGHVEPLPTGKALLEYWCSRVGKAERAILEALGKSTGTGTGEAYLYKGDIAQLAGYAVTGGGFNNALSALRTKGLITGNKDIALAEDLRS